ncbi:hypothetical protein KOW79_021668 [Hemibagrus wyckioides]|uniref:Uncharacterized protein n=1 Tax=Hemibagrus wyckioides TaxID=337641 RepID=A0A9D3N2N2_9TELE|nr:hypothetical protein KOW79_021668 [Hemibagrus wyckioides]
MRKELIQGVSSVPPLADELFQKKYISKEAYNNICSKSTSQNQMRELYKYLNNKTIKSAFYEALLKEDSLLLEELEKKYKSPDPSPNEFHGSPKGLKEWKRNSIAHRAKFENLLKDPELQKPGNGKLRLCTKDDYSIGNGSEGTQVYIGLRDDGTEVAVKRMLKVKYKQLKNEMELLRDPKLEHRNIVRYLDFTEDRDFYYLCLQLCEYNFEDYKKIKELDQEALKKVVKEMLLGLQVLHNAGIIHRDIKPSNILIDARENVRLSDFGISRMVNQDASTVYTARAGTRGWEAAEILKGDGQCAYKRSSDIQVAGMLVYYILSRGFHPFGNVYIVEENIRKGNYQLDQTTDVEAKDLIEKMIAPEPPDRLSVAEAVDHPYFWDDEGRDDFLRTIGDKEPVQNYKDVDGELRKALEKHAQFFGWKSKMSDSVPHNLPDNSTKRFYENNMYKDLFPEFYVCANQLAKDMGWK